MTICSLFVFFGFLGVVISSDLHNSARAPAGPPAGRMGSPMAATAQLPWAMLPLRFPEITYNPKRNPKRNPWRMESAPAQQPTGATRRQGAPHILLGRIRAVEATAQDFRAFTESPDHQIVVLGQRESLTSVAPFSLGSRRYVAKLFSCGVDLQLSFAVTPSSLTYSALGGPPHEAPGSVLFLYGATFTDIRITSMWIFPLRLPLQVSQRTRFCPRIARVDRDGPFVRPAFIALILGKFRRRRSSDTRRSSSPSSTDAGWIVRPY